MKILLATDGSRHARAAADFLTEFPLPRDSHVTLLTVVDEQQAFVYGVGVVGELLVPLRDKCASLLTRESAYLQSLKRPVETVSREGDVALEIIEAANQFGTELVVVGCRGLSDFDRLVLGSVSEKVVKYAPSSVLVVRQRDNHLGSGEKPLASQSEHDGSFHILVAFDGTPPALAAIDTLAALPLRERTSITILTAVGEQAGFPDVRRGQKWLEQEKQSARTLLESAAERLSATVSGVAIQIVEGNASQEIIAAASRTGADLVILGHQGKSGIERFVPGKVCSQVVRHASCSVWVHKT